MLEGDREPGATFAPDDICWIDFEARGRRSIRHGTYAYACAADAIILTWAIGDGPVSAVSVSTFDGPLRYRELPSAIKLHYARAVAGSATFAAWNAGFDKAIWNFATVDFPPLEARHIIDVMAQATASGLPPDLSMASRVVGGPRKQDSGQDFIKLFCLPEFTATPETHPAAWAEFRDEYATADIEAMRSVFRHTFQLTRAEWAEYHAMEKINERGVFIDLGMVSTAARLADEDKRRSAMEISALTRGAVETVDQVTKMTDWLRDQLPAGARDILLKREEEVDDKGEITRPPKFSLKRRQVERLIAYTKDAIETAGAPPKPTDKLVRAERVLQIRLYGGSKTPQKFKKMLEQHVDGVLYGQYVFNGAAQTGRASSKGVQVHNLAARDVLPYEADAIDALMERRQIRRI